MGTSHELKDRHILVAVDETENGKRAVLYVADILGGVPGFRATILHVVPEPPEDYFASQEEARDWRKEHEEAAREMVENYREILHQSGFGEGKVSLMLETRYCPSVAEWIFGKVRELDACTVVVGRRGISTKEEFILGSTSSRLLHVAKNCAVWVVE